METQRAPTTFSEPVRVVVACTYDPLGLQGPLHVWLRELTGLRCELAWVGYGMVVDSLRDRASAWGANQKGINVLLVRATDLHRATPVVAATELVALLKASCAARRGPTIVLLPPTPEREDEEGAQLARMLRADSEMRVVDCAALRAAFGALQHSAHSPFLDRVAHAPYSPAGCSVLASAVVRELCRAVAPKRKAYLLDCDNTLWGGAVGEVGARMTWVGRRMVSAPRPNRIAMAS
jgi:hypothetical protein